MTTGRGPRPITIAAIALAVIPWLAPVSLYAARVVGRIALGHWSRPSIDDPKGIGSLELALLIVRGFMQLWLLALPLALVGAASLTIYWGAEQSRWAGRLALVLLLSWAASALALWVDLGGAVSWFLD